MKIPNILLSAFRQKFNAEPTLVARAPGRVNLMGEHTDYNDGYVLPMAIDRAVTIVAAPCSSRLASLAALDLDQATTFRLDGLADRVDAHGQPIKDWARYPAGVAWALGQRGLPVSGVDAVFTSSVPIGAGLSSSAAVEVAFAALWRALGDWEMDAMTLAQTARQAEVQYVGVNCGLMDRFASAHGRAGRAMFFDCRTLEWQPVPLPAGSAVVVADTKVRRSLTGSEYNVRNAQCQEAVRLLAEHLPGIRALRDVAPDDFARYAGGLPELIRRRAKHVIEDCDRVLKSVEWLRAGDTTSFGQAMFDCHASLRDLYEVSCPELDAMVEAARRLDGCFGARLTGAGFGGCAVALVAAEAAPQFERELADRYEAATGIKPDIYVCQAADGAEATHAVEAS